jgi:TatD DNase family protein
MNVRYIDTHCHLQFPDYAHDRNEIIERMREEQIAAIVVGVDAESSKEAVALAEKHEHLFAAVGIHPNHAGQEPFDEKLFRELAAHPKVVALGECGLDFFHMERNDGTMHAQKELLQKHIALAAALDKPLIAHVRSKKESRDAYQELISILQEAKTTYPKLRGDIHFFAGNIAEAEEFFKLDFTVSFTAVITFAREYDKIIQAVPLRNILSETDAPYIAPASRRGERNDPLAVIDVVSKIAEIRGEDTEKVRQTLLANAKRVFALPHIEK